MNHSLDLPIRAATETAVAHGLTPDRCDILQNSSTLVLRLSESLVARVVQDLDGPRQGGAWFARENAVARHLAHHGAPVIPMHPEIPPGPHEHLGYTLNFWQYVTTIDAEPEPAAIGATLQHCHRVLATFPEPLPALAILTESHELLETLDHRGLFPTETLRLLDHHLVKSIRELAVFPHQPLHGDAHPGNMMNTTLGLLWTDWEDTFSGPAEWDLASVIWNASILEQDTVYTEGVRRSYLEAGGSIDEQALHHSLIGRACVMTAWYPILYPDLTPMRRSRLQRRIDWLQALQG